MSSDRVCYTADEILDGVDRFPLKGLHDGMAARKLFIVVVVIV